MVALILSLSLFIMGRIEGNTTLGYIGTIIGAIIFFLAFISIIQDAIQEVKEHIENTPEEEE